MIDGYVVYDDLASEIIRVVTGFDKESGLYTIRMNNGLKVYDIYVGDNYFDFADALNETFVSDFDAVNEIGGHIELIAREA